MVKREAEDVKFDKIFNALAHSIQQAILEQLANGREPVSGIAERHYMSLIAPSKHGHNLETAGLGETETDDRTRRYHLKLRR